MKGTCLQLDKTGDEVKGVGAQLQNVNVVEAVVTQHFHAFTPSRG